MNRLLWWLLLRLAELAESWHIGELPDGPDDQDPCPECHSAPGTHRLFCSLNAPC